MAPRKGKKKSEYDGLTLEKLDKLKTRAMIMEERINIMGEKCMVKSGTLCDSEMSSLSNEYEDICLDIEKREALLESLKKEE